MSQKLKIWICVAVLLGTLVWIALLIGPNPKPKTTPVTPAQQAVAAAAGMTKEEAFLSVSLVAGADGSSVLVTGAVEGQARLDELKSRLAALAPGIQFDYQVNTNR